MVTTALKDAAAEIERLQAALAEKDKECQRLRRHLKEIARLDNGQGGLLMNITDCCKHARAALAKEGA